MHLSDNKLKKEELRQVLCGTIPFDNLWWPFEVVVEVRNGGRPAKPEGVARLGFTDGLWGIVEQCWLADGNARPTLRATLSCLKEAVSSWDGRRKVV